MLPQTARSNILKKTTWLKRPVPVLFVEYTVPLLQTLRYICMTYDKGGRRAREVGMIASLSKRKLIEVAYIEGRIELGTRMRRRVQCIARCSTTCTQ